MDEVVSLAAGWGVTTGDFSIADGCMYRKVLITEI